MRIVHTSEAKKFENSKACIGLDYALGDKDINCAIITVDGRYPATAYVTNTVCKELVYIVKGAGNIGVNKKEYPLMTGDMFILMPGDKYFFEGKLEMVVPCAPAWYPEQHKEVN